MGLNVLLAYICVSLHTEHAGWLSFWERSLSFSPCKLQIFSDPAERLSFLSFRNDLHKFFNTGLQEGFFEGLLPQTGHSRVSLVLHNCCRHSLQTLWLHDNRTGALKISWHTGQDSSSIFSESIFTVWALAFETLEKKNNHDNHKDLLSV